MCDDGEKTCPLCAEEMDLTDQQLKPCKCGYEICVWCWHHIMEMAEKDETDGRCPACRTPYDKEKIVGMASKCEKVVAEVNMEKKMKSQKTKAKSLEGRKQFSSVRVIQRNLVYIVGLPLNLADEDILQRREYFGQYGKVLKVSMSRTAAGVVQQFPNNTCSVYITYAKEEEAIRCIQYVHGFTLDGRSLRACFGTTKYCHAWLRNMPCNNPDCLYLHEVGSQEDSFTKDEIISAYTRVEQITANVNTTHRRSGNVLPPPVDNNSNGATAPGKPITKSVLNSATTVKGSPPNGSTVRSIGLPAAASWGTRALSCSTHSAGSECSDGPTKLKSDPSIGETTAQATLLPTCSLKSALLNGEIHAKRRVDSSNAYPDLDSEISKSNKQDGSMASVTKFIGQVCVPSNNSRSIGISMIPNDGTLEISNNPTEAEVNDMMIQNLGFDVTSLSINGGNQHESSGASKSVSDPHFIGSPENQDLHQKLHEEWCNVGLTSSNVRKTSLDESPSTNMKATTDTIVEEDVLSFDNQRQLDPEVNHKVYSSNLIAPPSENLISSLLQPHSTHRATGSSGFLHASIGSEIPNGCAGYSLLDPACLQINVEQSSLRGGHDGALQGDAASCEKNGILDAGESSIISNILSWDFDPWNHSLTSPHNLAKLLGATDKQQGSTSSLDSWKAQSNNQSRFSFARQEESINEPFSADPSFGGYGQVPRNIPTGDDKEFHLHTLGFGNGFPSRSSAEIINFSDSQYATNKSSVTRSQISAPPGFSVPSKAPPPGFSCIERMDQTSGSLSGNRLLDMPTFFGNTETQLNGSSMGSSVDIEFIDPAILAVGKGRLQAGGLGSAGFDIGSSPHQSRALGSDSRLDLLTQRPISHQSLQYQTRDGYSLGDSFSVPSRILDQPSMGNLNYTQVPSFQQVRNSVMENGYYWNGWNEMHGAGNGMVMTELLGNERLGMSKLFTGYEEWKFKMSNSVDLHSRTFGM
ncbi:hypothetical protein SAY87_001910 [Trapa incisa]|uniref:CCR4-NOT transcription complex subunit 4 n=1 Tax=Trapa incisa TaxID=236973 RepID=A0AAN7JU35_9MYRT|nr:hypothetical protein SAY87_001910 [Trapa incisa]